MKHTINDKHAAPLPSHSAENKCKQSSRRQVIYFDVLFFARIDPLNNENRILMRVLVMWRETDH